MVRELAGSPAGYLTRSGAAEVSPGITSADTSTRCSGRFREEREIIYGIVFV